MYERPYCRCVFPQQNVCIEELFALDSQVRISHGGAVLYTCYYPVRFQVRIHAVTMIIQWVKKRKRPMKINAPRSQ